MPRVADAYVEPLRWWERLHCLSLDTAWHVRGWYLTKQWKRRKRKRSA